MTVEGGGVAAVEIFGVAVVVVLVVMVVATVVADVSSNINP